MEKESKYISFWIRDLHQNLVEYSCNPSMLNNICVNDKPDLPLDITPVFFKREVLSKYYNAPHKYRVQDGRIKFIEEGYELRVDTDMRDYVAVILVDLAFLDYSEQCYWRAFNLQPDDNTTISAAAYNRWYEGQFAEPVFPDATLVQKYTKFYADWKTKTGWHLFTENPEDKKSVLYSLHMLSDENNEREFYEQVLNVTKLFIDSLNVTQFPKLENPDNGKSLKRFEAYFRQNGINVSGLIDFLHNLQSLRSKGAAHPGTITQKIAAYFGLGTNTYGYIVGSIFATLAKILDTLIEIADIISERNKV